MGFGELRDNFINKLTLSLSISAGCWLLINDVYKEDHAYGS
jgi:hypothetical protein